MAFCPNCGAQAAGNFCPNCGTNIAAAGAAAGAGGGTGTSAGYAAPPVSAAGLNENTASALCYLAGLITGIIFLVLAPYNQNRTVRFHAFQSIFLTIAYIVVQICWSMISFATHGLGFLLYPLIVLLFFGVWLYMMYTAYNGRKVKLPVIGDLAEKQA